jgi:hypothetical protein
MSHKTRPRHLQTTQTPSASTLPAMQKPLVESILTLPNELIMCIAENLLPIHIYSLAIAFSTSTRAQNKFRLMVSLATEHCIQREFLALCVLIPPTAVDQRRWLLHILHQIPCAAEHLLPVNQNPSFMPSQVCSEYFWCFHDLFELGSMIRGKVQGKFAIAAPDCWRGGMGVYPFLPFGIYGALTAPDAGTPLHVAVVMHNVEALKAMLCFLSLLVDSKLRMMIEGSLNYVLHWAAVYGRIEEGEVILAWSSNPTSLLYFDGSPTVAADCFHDYLNFI